MELKRLITEDRDMLLKETLQVHNKTKEELDKDVEILKNWIDTQQHLPETPNTNMIQNFLLITKFSIELAKQKLDMYYSIRSLVPEIFRNKDPNSMLMKETAETVSIVILPKLMKNCIRVGIVQLKNNDHNKFDCYGFVAYCYRICDIRITEDVCNKDAIIYDLKNVTSKHITKITPVGLKKSAIVLEKVYSNRVAEIHFINCPPYAETLINLVKSVLKPKLANRIRAHKGTETLAEYIPKEILPSDFGGDEISLSELNSLWMQKYEQYHNRFQELDLMTVDESLRSTPLDNDEFLGFHGNFKKLSID